MGTVWAFIKMLVEIWEAIKVALGMVKKAQHDHELSDIDEKAKEAGDPTKPLEDRLKAGQDLEDKFNSHT